VASDIQPGTEGVEVEGPGNRQRGETLVER